MIDSSPIPIPRWCTVGRKFQNKCKAKDVQFLPATILHMLVRLATASDLSALMLLKGSAGWNQTEDDWLRLLRLAPHGCFVLDVDGAIAGSTTVVTYPGNLAWIGMVLTLPEYRGRGIARRLMEAALEYCGDQTVRLDASDMGKPLYESLGFQTECAIERWVRAPGACEGACVGEFRFDRGVDQEIFGADRSTLMEELMAFESASVHDAGYALGRPGSNAAFFGPCIGDNPDVAEALFRWFTHRHSHESVYVDLFPVHEHAPRIAAGLDFQPIRKLTRMVRRPVATMIPDERIYAIAGFEYG